MVEKLSLILPEIVLFIATCVVMVIGLSPQREIRRLCAWVCAVALVVAGGLAANTPLDSEAASSLLIPGMLPFVKGLIAVVGLMLVLLAAGTVDRAREELIASGKVSFDPLRSERAEFYAFFMFSLTGLMLCVSADDLIWLFLALELTSLPSYIMVTMSTRKSASQEAGVKYFFLGALGAAIFLYGFALLYGATGTTDLREIAAVFQSGEISTIGITGLIVALLGIFFKIAAVPMHFYTADVYQGASSSVSAFLAFVPKTAGFIAILLLCAAAGWVHGPDGSSLPMAVEMLLWITAALTMTVGNVLALLQSSVKRILAYSSIAHSGYMLVGVIAGPGLGEGFADNGIAAVLFYLLCYGVMNVGTFAVLASLRDADGNEADDISSIRGLCGRHPALGWTLILCSLSLLGLPPLLGFFGKLGLFTSAISAGHIPLVIILGINSAIAAFYYLRLISAAYLDTPEEGDRVFDVPADMLTRPIAGLVSAGGVIVLAFAGGALIQNAADASRVSPVTPIQAEQVIDAELELSRSDELPTGGLVERVTSD